jgi:alkylhydroperoxidase family enzyme
MPRLPYSDPTATPDDVAEWLSHMPKATVIDMLSHSVSTVQPFLQQAAAFFTSLELPERAREVTILVTAALIECEYESVQHLPIAEAAGVAAGTREILQRRDFESSELSSQDRALAHFIEQVVATPKISDEVFDDLRPHFSDREIVEILQIIGFYWSLGRLCTVLEVDIEYPDGLSSFQAVVDVGRKK